MKKLLIAFFFLLTLVNLAAAETVYTSKEWEYILLEDGSAEIVKYKGTQKVVTVPSKFGKATVTSLGESVFDYNETVQEVKISNKVKSIGARAFYNCSSLKRVSISQSVTTIGEAAFAFCANLSAIKIPNGVTSIGDMAFYGCSAPKEIVIPGSVRSIGDSAFMHCENVERLILNEGITTIGNNAFVGMWNVRSVTIPESVISIGDAAFAGAHLSTINIPNNTTHLGTTALPPDLVDIQIAPDHPRFEFVDGVLFDKIEKRLIRYTPNDMYGNTYIVPDGTLTIDKDAFSRSEWHDQEANVLNKGYFTIPASVNAIGINAFNPEDTLTVYPGSYAEKYANDNNLSYTYAVADSSWACACGNVNSFNFCVKCGAPRPDAAAYEAEDEAPGVSNGDFSYVLLDNGTAMITGYTGNDAELTLPSRLDGIPVTAIQPMAIASETLTRITIPDAIVNVTGTPFFLCPKLTSIEVSLEHPTLASIDGVLFYKPTKKLLAYPVGRTDTSYTVPQKIEIIGESAFLQSETLVDITLPDSIRRIEPSAFDCCYSLSGINLPDGLTDIGDSAFTGCAALTSISIPDSAVNVDGNPFVLCNKLESISVSLEHPTLAVIDGALFNKASKTLIVYPAGRVAEQFEIPQGIKKIGHHAFGYGNVQTIVIPDSVTEIEEFAFALSQALTSITIPATVTTVGSDLFSACPNVSVTLTRNSPLVPELKESGIAYTYSDLYDWLN